MAYTAPSGKTLRTKRGSITDKIAAEFALVDAEMEALAVAGMTALPEGEIYVGDATGAAAAVAMSGDATIDKTGAVTIGAKKVTESMVALANGKILVGDGTGVAVACTPSGDVTMTNAGAFSLATNSIDPTTLDLGTEAYIIVADAAGGGAAVAMSGDVTIDKVGATTIGAKKVDPGMVALTEAHILVGDAGAGSDVAVSGDVTISKLGAVTIGAKKVTEGMVALADGKILVGGATGAAAAQTPGGIVTMSNAGSFAIPLAEGNILVGNGAGTSIAASVAMSGDATISKLGAVTIGAKKVTPSMVALTEAHIMVGDGGAGSDVALSGDATIDKTGALTIASGAVEASMIADSILTGAKAAVVASDNVVGGIPIIYEVAIEHATANNDIIITYKSKVLDFWFIPSGTPTADDKVQLLNGVNAITDNIACTASANAIVRPTLIDDTYSTINAGGTMRIAATASSAVAGNAYVLAMRVT